MLNIISESRSQTPLYNNNTHIFQISQNIPITKSKEKINKGKTNHSQVKSK